MMESEAHYHHLNEAVHRILEIGLTISIALFLIGVTLSLVRGIPLPNVVTPPGKALHLVTALQPAGFLSLGLLALIITPFLRVMGSLLVFLLEHDWLYTGVTAIVFLVMLTSALLGRG